MAAPAITSILPKSAPAGSTVVITGTGFTLDTSSIVFGGYDAGPNYNVISDTDIAVVVPAGSGTVSIRVTTPGGTSPDTSADDFTYSAYEGGTGNVPTFTTYVSPTSSADPYGRGGDSVTLTGTGFTTARYVSFGSALAPFTIVSDTVITATSPPGAGTVEVTVENAFGTSGTPSTPAWNDFAYPGVTAPVLTDISPTTGWEGAEVTLTGTGFMDGNGTETVSEVQFYNGVPANFRTLNATTIIAVVPQGLTTGVVTIFYVGGSDASASSFTPKGTMNAFQASADGKNTITYNTTTPNGTSSWGSGTTDYAAYTGAANTAGDTWFQYGTTGPPDLSKVVVGQFTGQGGTSWKRTALSSTVLANIDAGVITTGILSGIQITGNTINTAASGARTELSSSYQGIKFYSGQSGETPSSIHAEAWNGNYGVVRLLGPSFNGLEAPQVELQGDGVLGGSAYFYAGPASYIFCDAYNGEMTLHASLNVTVDSALQVNNLTELLGSCNVYGRVNPGTNFPGVSTGWNSTDGIWVQDNNTPSLRWKITFNSSTKAMSISRASTRYTVQFS